MHAISCTALSICLIHSILFLPPDGLLNLFLEMTRTPLPFHIHRKNPGRQPSFGDYAPSLEPQLFFLPRGHAGLNALA